MNTNKLKLPAFTIVSVILGVILGATGYGYLFSGDSLLQDKGESSEEQKPLYWVAPMDPNYRRDEPGKSPMGMELKPVYAQKDEEDSPGTIRISPDIINNIGVRTDIAHAMPLKTSIQTVGYVQYDEDQLVHIHPRVEGWIEKLYVKSSGDQVTKGMPLYDIYSPVLVNAQDELLLALAQNKTSLIRSTVNRMRALKIPNSLIDRIKKTKKVEQTVTIFAPQDGVVDNLTIREGFFVQPGTTLMSIGALKQVWVKAEVFERQASLVKKGDAVTMTLDFLPSRTWEGEIDYVYPVLDAKTRTVPVRMRFANENLELKPNMFAQITIHGNDTKPTLLIPREALIRTGSSDRVVMALGEGKFKSIAVSVGRLDRNRAEILEGIKAGDKVVVSAQFMLDSESSITSDFKRMSHGKDVERSVWAQGTIESLMVDHRMLKVTHQPIEAWDWPQMTMDFDVAKDVDLEKAKKGMSIHFQITQTNTGHYQVTSIHIPDQAQKKTNEEMDHSQHKMKETEEEVDDSQHKGMEMSP